MDFALARPKTVSVLLVEPFACAGAKVFVTACIGTALGALGDEEGAEALIHRAEAAAYEAASQ